MNATQNQPTPRRKRITPPKPSRAELLAEYNLLPENARINEQMLAAVLLCSLAKLQRDRWSGGGIPFIREGGTSKADRNGRVQIFGGKVFYLKKDVEAHLASKQAITRTSAIDQAAIHKKKS
jgi:hypothetical protein